MTLQKALHPSDNIDTLCVSRREEGRGHDNIEDSVDELIRGIEDVIKKSKDYYSGKLQHWQCKEKKNNNKI